MPVTLVIRRVGQEPLPPLTFDAPRVVIGRGSSCDVRVPDPSVSGRHASIRSRDAGWVVCDEGSTNGTLLNGEKLSVQAPRAIKSGDVLQCGRVEIAVRLGAAVPSSSTATREIALSLVRQVLGEAGEHRARIKVVSGPDAGAERELTAGTTLIVGRDPRCGLRLMDRAVPPMAVEIHNQEGQPRVQRRDPRGEALLQGRELAPAEWVMWPDGAALVLGNTHLLLDDPLSRALEQSSAGVDLPLSSLTADAPAGPAEAPGAVPSGPTESTEEASGDPSGDPSRAPSAAAALSPGPATLPSQSPPAPAARPRIDRRRRWRGAGRALEVLALVLGLLVLGGSAAGIYWLLGR